MSKRRKRPTGLPLFIGQQNYKSLQSECIKKKQKFVDLVFPPENSSLFLDPERSSEIVWKRPGELVDDPKLFVEGASPNDVTQGILGNCWFVSACSALTHNEELLQKVIPEWETQEWDPSNEYCGIFRFRFWRFGEWIEIVIDDLLPTKDGKLLFARSKTENEFWSALLEKAFAKLYGCYENLVGGQLSDALQDVSGGVAETISVKKILDGTKDKDEKLFHLIRGAFEKHALIVAAIAARSKEEIEKSLSCGLVKGHAYAVTMVRYIDLDAKKQTLLSSLFGSNANKVAMIRLQNPWGEIEWNGPWSDTDSRWEEVTEAQKHELGMTVDEDGEFWMPWEEFVKYFTDISVCQLFNTGCSTASGVFNEYIFFDEWTTNGVKCGAPKDRSGGCQNFSATFCFNPQYRFDVYEPGSEMMIALTQKEIQNEAAKQREPYVTIGLHVMKVETNRRHRIHQAINPVGTSDYASARSVYLHLTDIGPGRYILMPTTYAPREQAEYMLRIYSPHDCNPKLLLRDFPKTSPFMCTKIRSVTRLKIIEATIHNPPKDSNLFISITSDKERVRTISQKSSSLVEWNEPFVFHRNDLRQKYSIELIHEGPKRLHRIGKCILTGLTDNDTRIQLLDIQSDDGRGGGGGGGGEGKRSNNLAKTRIGNLKVEISSFDDHMYL